MNIYLVGQHLALGQRPEDIYAQLNAVHVKAKQEPSFANVVSAPLEALYGTTPLSSELVYSLVSCADSKKLLNLSEAEEIFSVKLGLEQFSQGDEFLRKVRTMFACLHSLEKDKLNGAARLMVVIER